MTLFFHRFFLAALVLGISSAAHAQFGPFSGGGDNSESDLPESLAVDLIEPGLTSRQTTADEFARVFSKELRDISEQQAEMITALEGLPGFYQAMNASIYFGYHSGESRQRPKWVQVDLGATVEPDAVALIPVTVQREGATIIGYGFPRSFRIDISNDPNFENYETIREIRRTGTTNRTKQKRAPFYQPVAGFSGRYIRVTATNLWKDENDSGLEAFALSELMVLNGDRNIAMGKRVHGLDSAELSTRWSQRFLTDGITSLGVPTMASESPTMGFQADTKKKATPSTWVQVDLEEALSVDEIQIILATPDEPVPDLLRFPYGLKVEISDHPDMRKAELAGRFTSGQIANVGENPLIIQTKDGYGRYVRITAETSKPVPMKFELAEVQIFSGNRNVALGKSVTAPASNETNVWSRQFLVDGYSSRRKLAGADEWLSALSERSNLIGEWQEMEQKRLELVDQTVEKSFTWIGGGLLGIVGFVIFGLRRSRLTRRQEIESIRQQIASDLHDDIGSNLSSIALLAELGHDEANEPELSREEFEEIKKTADKTIEAMRDIVWLILPGEETWTQMLARFRETAATLLKAHTYNLDVKGKVNDEKLPLDFKRDLFMIYKEILNNIVKHADARRVDILVDTSKDMLILQIVDDGKGFNNLEAEFSEGNGLRNLRMRAQNLGASIKVKSAIGEGTRIKLVAPMP